MDALQVRGVDTRRFIRKVDGSLDGHDLTGEEFHGNPFVSKR
ncbi:MAG TPA: hypothetical protein VJ386_10410 [Candidatus Deferrimicrobiaceae bacterium]|nr:hypothetical protein [Candidatus Deferrimicrobiaceae bacterium]